MLSVVRNRLAYLLAYVDETIRRHGLRGLHLDGEYPRIIVSTPTVGVLKEAIKRLTARGVIELP